MGRCSVFRRRFSACPSGLSTGRTFDPCDASSRTNWVHLKRRGGVHVHLQAFPSSTIWLRRKRSMSVFILNPDGSINNAEIICTVRPAARMIKAGAYVSRLIQRALCSSSFACGRVKNALAQAKRLWRRLHVLIDVDVFDRALQTHSEDSFKLNSFAVALAAHVREVLFLARIDWKLFRTPYF